MSTHPARPRKRRTFYFWLMLCLYVMLAVGLLLLAAGIVYGRPPIPPVTAV